MDNQEKRREIIEILTELSKKRNLSEEYYENILITFKEIYSNDFRHFYSDITALLLNINSKIINDENSPSIDLLGENIRTIYEFAIEKDFIFKENLGKLNDHITMDLARLKEWSKIINKSQNIYSDIKQSTIKMNEIESKMNTATKKLSSAYKKIHVASNEAKNVKKDLLSIMGIFMGIFSFIQWNFSQYKDLLEYDPFSRVLYIFILNSILILSLYFVFSIIDFIVHQNPRMVKVFFDINTRKPTKFFGWSLFIYFIFLVIFSYGLHSDSGRKTINNIEKQIKLLDKEHKNSKSEYKMLLDKKTEKINELEEQVKILNSEHAEYKESLDKKVEEINELRKQINFLIKTNEEQQKKYKELLDRKINQIEILENNNTKKQDK